MKEAQCISGLLAFQIFCFAALLMVYGISQRNIPAQDTHVYLLVPKGMGQKGVFFIN